MENRNDFMIAVSWLEMVLLTGLSYLAFRGWCRTSGWPLAALSHPCSSLPSQ